MDLNTSQELHLAHYWNIIYKRWRVALSILLVVMAGTLLASYFSKPLYRSSIELQIERENPNQLTIEDLFGIASSDQEFLQTQYVLLRSHGLAARVVREQHLLNDRDFNPAGVAGKSQKDLDAMAESMAGMVQGGLEVKPVPNTSLVEIAY